MGIAVGVGMSVGWREAHATESSTANIKPVTWGNNLL
jgi:hypothetical protein